MVVRATWEGFVRTTGGEGGGKGGAVRAAGEAIVRSWEGSYETCWVVS